MIFVQSLWAEVMCPRHVKKRARWCQAGLVKRGETRAVLDLLY